MKKVVLCLLMIILGKSLPGQEMVYESENLKIEKLSENTYRHITYLNTDQYGKVACNGLIVISEGESAVFDTPSYDRDSEELITWLQDSMKTNIKIVVVNHHHIDCLGGLGAFHKLGIRSVSSEISKQLAEKDGGYVPQTGFDEEFRFTVGSQEIINKNIGHAHADGALISYVTGEEVLFGGCSVKSLGSGKGNLNDADVTEWPLAIEKVSKSFSSVKVVVPGHGKTGNQELLDYTIRMFRE